MLLKLKLMSGLETEKGSSKNTKYGFWTIFGLNEGRYGMRNWDPPSSQTNGTMARQACGRWKERSWEDGRVGKMRKGERGRLGEREKGGTGVNGLIRRRSAAIFH